MLHNIWNEIVHCCIMAVHGSFVEFNPHFEDQNYYMECLENYFIADGFRLMALSDDKCEVPPPIRNDLQGNGAQQTP